MKNKDKYKDNNAKAIQQLQNAGIFYRMNEALRKVEL